MPISKEEQIDLDIMKAEQAKVRENAFTQLRMALRWNQTEMESAGYGRYTKEKMIQMMVERSLLQIDSLVQKHIRKYPD